MSFGTIVWVQADASDDTEWEEDEALSNRPKKYNKKRKAATKSKPHTQLVLDNTNPGENGERNN